MHEGLPLSESDMSFGGQGKNKQPREKIRGSQFWKREEKVFPKTIIRNPFFPKDRPKPSIAPKKPA